jgi:hypothetical protein
MNDHDVLTAAKLLTSRHEFVTVRTVAEQLGVSELSEVERSLRRLQQARKLSIGLATSAAGCFVTYTPDDL